MRPKNFSLAARFSKSEEFSNKKSFSERQSIAVQLIQLEHLFTVRFIQNDFFQVADDFVAPGTDDERYFFTQASTTSTTTTTTTQTPRQGYFYIYKNEIINIKSNER